MQRTASRSVGKRLLGFAKLAVTLGAFAYLLSRIELSKVAGAMLRVPAASIALALAFGLLGTAFAAARWGVMLKSCGAERVPGPVRLFGLMMITLFYNNFLPGAVGGEIVRGYATADSFDKNGLARALGVSLLDRLFGLAGLLTLTAAAFSLRPLPQVEGLLAVCALGAAALSALIVGLALSPRFGSRLPGPLARLTAQLPELHTPLGILPALVLSLGTQACAVLMGYCLLEPLEPDVVTLVLAFTVLPVATAAAYFPLSIAGAGARELAFVVLLAKVGVAESAALAAALLLLACTLLLGAIGGVVNIFFPLRPSA